MGKRELERNESKADIGRLKSASTKSGEPSSGNQLITVSSSLRNSPRTPGGRQITIMLRLSGQVTVTAWNSQIRRWTGEKGRKDQISTQEKWVDLWHHRDDQMLSDYKRKHSQMKREQLEQQCLSPSEPQYQGTVIMGHCVEIDEENKQLNTFQNKAVTQQNVEKVKGSEYFSECTVLTTPGDIRSPLTIE